MADSRNDSGYVILFLCLFVWWAGASVAHSRLRYSLQYDATMDQVTIDKEPQDCDFWHAPIGDKSCHYDRNVVVVRRSHDVKTSRTVISYDEGKTWSWNDGDTEPEGTSVSVFWKKVEN